MGVIKIIINLKFILYKKGNPIRVAFSLDISTTIA